MEPACSSRLVVRADANGLQILLNNLVDNALRFTQRGDRGDLVAGVAQGHVYQQICDNGSGVPQADRERLFDRFYRPEGTTVWGCGLGLSVVRNIAEQHEAALPITAHEWGAGTARDIALSVECRHRRKGGLAGRRNAGRYLFQ